MKKTIKNILAASVVAALSTISAQAYTFQVDIDPAVYVAGDDGVTPFTGQALLGYFTAGTNFADPFADLDSNFVAVAEGAAGPGGFQLSVALPVGANWNNGELDGDAFSADWTSSAAQDAAWDSTFDAQDMVLVFVNGATVSDGFLGTPNSSLFNSITSYLIVDSGNNFANSVGSSLGTTFATLNTTDTVLKASGSAAVVPEPASALLLVGGLGAMALRRRRA